MPIHPLLSRMLKDLSSRGISREGLFRHTPAPNIVKKLLRDLDRGAEIDFSRYDIDLVAYVLRHYLQELPDPVIPTKYLSQFAKMSDFSFLWLLLPIPNRILLTSICDLLVLISESPIPRMDSESLGEVFGPLLVRTSHLVENEQLEVISKVTQSTMKLISDFAKIRPILISDINLSDTDASVQHIVKNFNSHTDSSFSSGKYGRKLVKSGSSSVTPLETNFLTRSYYREISQLDEELQNCISLLMTGEDVVFKSLEERIEKLEHSLETTQESLKEKHVTISELEKQLDNNAVKERSNKMMISSLGQEYQALTNEILGLENEIEENKVFSLGMVSGLESDSSSLKKQLSNKVILAKEVLAQKEDILSRKASREKELADFTAEIAKLTAEYRNSMSMHTSLSLAKELVEEQQANSKKRLVEIHQAFKIEKARLLDQYNSLINEQKSLRLLNEDSQRNREDQQECLAASTNFIVTSWSKFRSKEKEVMASYLRSLRNQRELDVLQTANNDFID